MRILDQRLDLSVFFDRVSRTPSRALLLDYDGTLAPFVMDPREARLYPGVAPIIQRLIDSKTTRIVFVSGRRIEDLAPLLPFTPLPELWGSHGYEHLAPDGTRQIFCPGPASLDCLARIREAISSVLVGVRHEIKAASIALHWRGDAPARIAQIRQKITAIWREASPCGTVVMDEFDGGVEFKAHDRTKGTAVAAMIADIGVGAYMGDDLTDEDAFPAISSVGISVLVRPHLRATSASMWIRPPEELEALLLDWEAACAGKCAARLAAFQTEEPLEALPWT